MVSAPRYVLQPAEDGPMFSICSLVRSQEKYDRLVASFARSGFSGANCEFLAADNREFNRFDGYSWHRALLAEARGHFVIFCHDDIELIDQGYSALVAALDALDRLDPGWLLAGVAGGAFRPAATETWKVNLLISDPWGEKRRIGEVPGRVETLDECFMLMRRVRPVVASLDLKGFHFYGPDLCLQAELMGGSSWVIDFHLRHHGRGTIDESFVEGRTAFIRKYASVFPGRRLHCTTGVLRLSVEDPAPRANGPRQESPAKPTVAAGPASLTPNRLT